MLANTRNWYLRWLYGIVMMTASCYRLTYGLNQRPNIIMIIADDMGFDDVSFRGSNEFITPNIDALAYSGVILKNFYTPAMCTPSRSALLTGKYPIHTGMQHYVIPNYQPWSLPVNETTMAEIFKQHGYYTSLLGKWHLGMSRRAYTPTLRGFDHHFGYLGAYIDYYDQTLYSSHKPYASGHDFRHNLDAIHANVGSYVTDLLTEAAVDLIRKHDNSKQPLFLMLSHLAPHSGNEKAPLQAPQEEIKKFAYIANSDRRIYAAMMSVLDKSVGHVIDALAEKQILNNTILLFFSDNGGPTIGQHATRASNYPLRGQKNSPWEGALRSSGAIWSSQLSKPGSVWNQHLYIADLLPTLATAAGIKLDTKNLDGLDMWQALLMGNEKEREILHNIDDIYNYVSYFNGKYKFINGTTLNGEFDNWLGKRPAADSNEIDPRAVDYAGVIKRTSVWQQLQALNGATKGTVDIENLRRATEVKCQYMQGNGQVKSPKVCQPLQSPCLFDISLDPCEQNNLYDEPAFKELSAQILKRVDHFRLSAHSPNNKPDDKRCDPRFYNYEWTWWEDMQDEQNTGNDNGAAVQLYHLSKGLLILFSLTISKWTKIML